MKVSEIRDSLELRQLNGTPAALERDVTGGYCGDLLSWVMGRAGAGQAWVTIMQNVNVAAVAALTDAACVILAEGVSPDDGLAKRAALDDLPLFVSDKAAYEISGRLYALLAK
ncbi:hypothetical protein FACS18949_00540 [Clostridia bacterium]|nr:hypothetical protein FACS189425_00710 [Clostridia bacterium]GHV31628.1 hypothetical protein FACS18949_00540 [Clostridia bacterium]